MKRGGASALVIKFPKPSSIEPKHDKDNAVKGPLSGNRLEWPDEPL